MDEFRLRLARLPFAYRLTGKSLSRIRPVAPGRLEGRKHHGALAVKVEASVARRLRTPPEAAKTSGL